MLRLPRALTLALCLLVPVPLAGCSHEADVALSVVNRSGNATTLVVVIKNMRDQPLYQKSFPVANTSQLSRVDTVNLPGDAYILNATAAGMWLEARRSLDDNTRSWIVYVQREKLEFAFGS